MRSETSSRNLKESNRFIPNLLRLSISHYWDFTPLLLAWITIVTASLLTSFYEVHVSEWGCNLCVKSFSKLNSHCPLQKRCWLMNTYSIYIYIVYSISCKKESQTNQKAQSSLDPHQIKIKLFLQRWGFWSHVCIFLNLFFVIYKFSAWFFFCKTNILHLPQELYMLIIVVDAV